MAGVLQGSDSWSLCYPQCILHPLEMSLGYMTWVTIFMRMTPISDVTFKKTCPDDLNVARSLIEVCISDVACSSCLVNIHWLLIDVRILKGKVITWLKPKPPFKTLSFGSLRNCIHICIYTAWISRRDLPLQGLSCCLVKHLNVSGSEVDTGSTCIKSTGNTICRVPRGKRVAETTVGLGYAVACSVVGYVQVVSSTKGWSVTGTCVNGVTVVTWLDVHLNRSVAIDVI